MSGFLEFSEFPLFVTAYWLLLLITDDHVLLQYYEVLLNNI